MTCMHVRSEHAGFVAKFAGKLGVVTMHVGLPPDQTFPLTSLSADTSSGDRIDITDPSKVGVLGVAGMTTCAACCVVA